MVDGTTPYHGQTTPDVTAARDSLADLLGSVLPPDERAACEWLHAYATEELARRLADFVAHTTAPIIGDALAALAFDVGMVRAQIAAPVVPHLAPPAPTALLRPGPVPVRGGGRRRG